MTAWTATLQTPVPHVTKPQVTVLALGTLGLGLARACALTAVSVFLAAWLSRTEPTVRQPWRACGYAATATRGRTRGALDVAFCLVPWRAWVVTRWQGTPWALARAATTWSTRLTVLALSGVSRGGATPGIWTVLPAPAPLPGAGSGGVCGARGGGRSPGRGR